MEGKYICQKCAVLIQYQLVTNGCTDTQGHSLLLYSGTNCTYEVSGEMKLAFDHWQTIYSGPHVETNC